MVSNNFMSSCIVHGQCFSGGTDCIAKGTAETAAGHMLRLDVTPNIAAFVGTEGTLETAPEPCLVFLHVLLYHLIEA
jgi:hypothetical protein